MIELNPYLNFGDNCEEAFNFYKSVFGGEFLYLGRYNELANEEGEEPVAESDANKIMHIALPISDGNILMGSDTPESFGAPTAGNNISISVSPDNEAEAKRLFEGLSAGGNILMPMEKTFFAEAFGMCVDKFNVRWMVVYTECQNG